jgi:hypothetical protein
MVGGAVALVSAVAAVFLVVFGDASRSASLGILLGLWAAVIGALSVVRAQEPVIAPEPLPEPSTEVELVAHPMPTAEELTAGMALELRRNAELEREAAAAERREFQLQLELMLRREVETVLKREMVALRQEIAGLRAEILEHVGGQLRLERIETTRLIGSDVQALQREVRRLASVRQALESSMDSDIEASVIHEVLDDIIDAQLAGEPATGDRAEAEPDMVGPEPELVEPELVEPELVEVDAAEAELVEVDAAEIEGAEPEAPEIQVAARRRDFDFADLPSISRLTPMPPESESPDHDRYTGRRRAAGAEAGAAELPEPRGGQRRARSTADDVLARLLGR